MIEREEMQMTKEGWSEAKINQTRQGAYQKIEAFIEESKINEKC